GGVDGGCKRVDVGRWGDAAADRRSRRDCLPPDAGLRSGTVLNSIPASGYGCHIPGGMAAYLLEPTGIYGRRGAGRRLNLASGTGFIRFMAVFSKRIESAEGYARVASRFAALALVAL